ncbi:hypothetical protein [Nitrospira sp. Kam-Ns4a]
MAWGIIMTGLMLAAMLGLVIFDITRDVGAAGASPPVIDPAEALARPVGQAKAA